MAHLLGPVVVLAVMLLGCGKSDPADLPKPVPEKQPELKFVGEPVKQAADFPKERWVRTTLFDGKTPFIGFTYIDPSKGNSIKGMKTDGVSPAELKAKLKGFPSATMSPIPEGHAMTLLTPEELKELELPAAPDWLASYK